MSARLRTPDPVPRRQLAAASGIEVLRTPGQAPQANAIVERFLGSVRRECLDHVLVLSENHLRRILRVYVAYLGQQVPLPPQRTNGRARSTGTTIAVPVLGGLHHEYRRAA